MTNALMGAGFQLGQALQGDMQFNSRIGKDTYEFMRAIYREGWFFPYTDWPTSTQVVSGSGATDVSRNMWAETSTGATHASTAGRYNTFTPTLGSNWAYIDWGKKFMIAFLAQWAGTDATNLTMRMHITQASTIINLAAHGLGIQTNGANVNLATYGTGGSQQLVSAATNLTNNKMHLFLIEHDPAVADSLYMDGPTAKATQSTAADIPSTEPAALYRIFVSIARTGGADIANEKFTVLGPLFGIKL